MPKLYNTVTKKWMFMPDSYVGKHPFRTEEEVAAPAPVANPVAEAPKPKAKSKKKAKVADSGYKSPALDGDGDGMIQDGTPFERPVGTELTEEEIATRLEADSE